MFWTIMGWACFAFLAILVVGAYFDYRNNPYRGYDFFVDNQEGENSALYIAKYDLFDGRGNRIPRYKRVSCVPGHRYTAAESDWSRFTLDSTGEPLVDFKQISEDNATALYKKHLRYTQEIKAEFG